MAAELKSLFLYVSKISINIHVTHYLSPRLIVGNTSYRGKLCNANRPALVLRQQVDDYKKYSQIKMYLDQKKTRATHNFTTSSI